MKDEELSPLAENFIIEKCLAKIDPRLPEHVKNSRGHLFNEERPTLACNQKILFSQIDTMLTELEGKESNIAVGQVRSTRTPYRPFRPPQNNFRPNFRPRLRQSFPSSFRNAYRPRPLLKLGQQ